MERGPHAFAFGSRAAGSADRRFAPARPSRGGPHGVPPGARETRTLREPGERAGESPLLHGLAVSSSTARVAPSPQRERRTAPPSTTAREVPTCAQRSSAGPSPPLGRTQRAVGRSGARARARGRFDVQVRVGVHGGGVSGWSTPRPRRRDLRSRARRRGAGDPGAKSGVGPDDAPRVARGAGHARPLLWIPRKSSVRQLGCPRVSPWALWLCVPTSPWVCPCRSILEAHNYTTKLHLRQIGRTRFRRSLAASASKCMSFRDLRAHGNALP